MAIVAFVSWVEWIAAGLGVVCVALVALRSIWNYPFGIASVGISFFVCFEAKLYSDALLQIFFVAVNVYGWWEWARSRAQVGEVAVERMTVQSRIGWAIGCAGTILLWGALMHRFTDASYPWWDGSIAIVSIAAQILQAQRKLESWWLWIAADLGSIPLFYLKDIPAFMILFVIYLGLAIWGLIDWYRAEKAMVHPGPAAA